MERIHIAFDFIETLEELRDPEHVLDKFQAFLSNFGLTTFVLGDIVNPYQAKAPIDPVFQTRWPPEWSARWQDNNYMEFDPVVLQTLRRRLPFFWHDIRPFQKGLQARIMDEGGEFRLFDGFSVPIHRRGQLPATVTLAGENLDLGHNEQKALHLAAIYTHAKIEQLVVQNERICLKPLSNREREVLHWIAAGKSVPTIGEILSLSEHTVYRYVKTAMQKLNTTTQAQTVAMALRTGQLAP